MIRNETSDLNFVIVQKDTIKLNDLNDIDPYLLEVDAGTNSWF
jgi:hypothetical protein